MSIINDALKKTQANLDKQENQTSESKKDLSKVYDKIHQRRDSSQTPPDAPEKKTSSAEGKRPSIRKLPLLLLIFVVLLGYYLNIQFHWVNRFPLARKVFFLDFDFLKKNPSPGMKAKTPPPPPRTYTSDTLTLSGIMTMDNRRVALINGKIYEAGETVNNKKITNISLQNVEVTDENGEIFILSVGEVK